MAKKRPPPDQTSQTPAMAISSNQTAGLTLCEALAAHSDPEEWKEYQQLLDQGYGASIFVLGGPENPEESCFLELGEKIKSSLLQRLRSGALITTGYDTRSPLGSGRAVIPPDSWNFLEPDYDESTAEGGGFSVSGILVHTPARHNAVPAASETVKGTVKAESECRTWIERRAASGQVPTSRDALFQEARKHFGNRLSRRAFNRAWRDVAPAEWRKPGRKS